MSGILLVTVGNSYGSKPVNTVAPVLSGTETVGQTLSVTTGTWVAAPPPTYTYQWQRNGSNIGGATASTYTLVSADAGQIIRCVVTATNPSGSTSANSNNSGSINAAPVNTVAPALSGTQTVGQTLSVTTGTWTGSPAPTYTYQWQRNASNIGGATSSSYTLVSADAGQIIRCVVTATNAVGSASANSNNSGNINQVPANTVAPVLSGTASVGSTLSVTTGTWTGYPTPTYTYQWQRNSSNIGGATSSTYTLVTADAGTTVRCVVTATNAVGSASANSNSTATVAQPPVNTAAPTISGADSYVGTVWTTTNGSWSGSPTPTYTYQWLRNGSDISGATSSTYTLTATDIGTTVTSRVTATNSAGSASATSSNSVSPQAKPIMVVGVYEAPAYKLWAYNFTPGTGFGSLYASSPTFNSGSTYMNSKGTVVFATGTSSPYAVAYAFSSSGWGSKYADPASNPGYYAYDGKLSPAQTTFAASVDTNPGIAVYPWNDSTGWGTKYATSGNTSPARAIAWYPSGTYVAKAGNGTNFGIQVYPFSTGGGLSSPIAPSGTVMGGGFAGVISGDGAYLFGSWSSQGYIARYNTWPEGVGNSPSFYDSGYTVVAAGTISGFPYSSQIDRNPAFSYVYAAGYGVTYGASTLGAWNNVTGYAAPASPTSTAIAGVGFGTNGLTLGFTTTVNPYIGAYAFTGASGLTTKYSAPATIPSNVSQATVAFPRSF